MKRISVFAFVVVIALMMVLPIAHADVDTEIVFSNTPWGIGVDELQKAMQSAGFFFNAEDVRDASYMPIWTYDFRHEWENSVKEAGYWIILNYWKDDNVKVAGYRLDSLYLYCHYDLTDGVLDRDRSKSHYYRADISLDVEKELVDASYTDLQNKLTKLYGSYVEDSFHITDYTYTCSTWTGANNTAVCLYKSRGDDGEYSFLHLLYGKTDCEATLNAIHDAAVREIGTPDPDDLSGITSLADVTPATEAYAQNSSQPTKGEETVWVATKGKKYHRKQSCSNMQSPRSIPLSEAIAAGYTPCKKCH